MKMDDDPFPIREVATIAVINSVNSASYLMTYPFVSFMILEFYPGLKETEIGYYSGILEGSFHIGSIIGSIFWGWYSDKYGRKPALILGLFGTILATIGFGFSPNFGSAIATRLLWGLLNGNVGVAKTALSEVCSDKHTAKAFSYIGLSNGVGRIFGPALGGLLSEPARKYSWGKIELFVTFPFLLPCLAAAGITVVTAVMTHFFLKETLTKKVHFQAVASTDEKVEEEEEEEEEEMDNDDEKKRLHSKSNEVKDENSKVVEIESTTIKIEKEDGEEEEEEEEATLLDSSSEENEKKAIITTPAAGGINLPANTATSATTSTSNNNNQADIEESPLQSMLRLSRDEAVFSCILLYMGLGFIGLVSAELYPIYVINDKAHGGFDLDSSAIGLLAMSGGPWMVVFQGLIYHRLTKYFGLRRFSMISLTLFSICLFTTPMQSFSLNFSKDVQWTVLYLHYGLTTVIRVSCFTSSFVFTANSAFPEDRGKVNGLGQATVSLARAVGPPLGTAIFAWSVSDVNRSFPFNYYFAWWICGFLVLILLFRTRNLPAWIETKRIVNSIRS